MTQEKTDFEKVERLIAIFKPERYTYLGISAASCIALVVMAIMSYDDIGIAGVAGMFTSGGAITFSMTRMMKMWNDVTKILFKQEFGADV